MLTTRAARSKPIAAWMSSTSFRRSRVAIIALSQSAADLALESVRAARAGGLTVSCDLNYRKNLWKYGKAASEVMRELVKFVDIAIANEEDFQAALGIEIAVDVHSG